MTILLNDATNWLKKIADESMDENTKIVIGISGGKDSTTVAALCKKVLGREKLICVQMPCGEQSDIDVSNKVVDFINPKERLVINIKDIKRDFSTLLSNVTKKDVNSCEGFQTNLPPRIRMSVLYSVAALYGNCRVSCNGNLSEKYVGWTTIFGDLAGDFAPLSWLFVDEVQQLGKELDIADEFVYKKPSDGMCGMTDEEKLGFLYSELKEFVENPEGCKLSQELKAKIKKKIQFASFKHELVNLPSFNPFNRKMESF